MDSREESQNNDNDINSKNENAEPENLGIETVERKITEARNKLDKDKGNKKIYKFIYFPCFIIIALYHSTLIIPLWLNMISWMFAVLFLLADFGTDADESNLNYWNSIKAFYYGKKDNAKYFDSLVQINISNLEAYYSLVKKHTQYSFVISSVIGILGFMLISGALVLSYFKISTNDITYIASGAGIFTEFISGIFFYLYSKTVRQLKDYHDSLLDVQNVLLAFRLIETTKDDNTNNSMKSKMIEFLVKKHSK